MKTLNNVKNDLDQKHDDDFTYDVVIDEESLNLGYYCLLIYGFLLEGRCFKIGTVQLILPFEIVVSKVEPKHANKHGECCQSEDAIFVVCQIYRGFDKQEYH